MSERANRDVSFWFLIVVSSEMLAMSQVAENSKLRMQRELKYEAYHAYPVPALVTRTEIVELTSSIKERGHQGPLCSVSIRLL